jgi:DNA primase large subunit
LRHVHPDKHKKMLDPLLSKINNSNAIKDSISHFVLRLAYCRTEDLRRWFLAQEVALLKFRLSQASTGSTTQALKSVLPNAKLLTQDELEPLLPKILAATPALNTVSTVVTATKDTMHKIYQVPFTQALDLLQHRQVYVHKGLAYIPESKLLNLVTAKFRTFLSRQLVLLSAVPSTPALQRTQGFLANVATVHAVKDEFQTDNSAADLNATNVAQHVKHMPLCMVQLQVGLQQNKHLKHWGRLQYGLFLKGAGLSLEDALLYFERMFAAKDFQKEYSYNVRHMYGKEGKRANYPPYSCSKIIHGNPPNAQDHHGCPYKHSSVQEVSRMLSQVGISEQKSILANQQSHQYQLACVEHFKAAHVDMPMQSVDNVGNHPNAWFHASVEAAAAAGKGVTTPATEAIAKPDAIKSTVSAVSP